MIFVGHQNNAYLAAEVAKEYGLEFELVQENYNIKEQINQIMMQRTNDYIIYDISQYINEAEEIAEQIYRISKAKSSVVIIYAPGYVVESKLIKELYRYGFVNFVLSVIPTDIKDDIVKCMNGYYTANPIPEIDVIREGVEKDLQNTKKVRTIAVAGCCSRIGTTTQAMQIIKYIQLLGYKACYIQMNSNKYVELIREYNDPVYYDEDLEWVGYMNVDMFYNINRINEYLALDYDFYIYDFGVYNAIDFNKVSYLEKDIKIFVGGIKPNEIENMNAVFSNAFYKDVLFIYSFVPENERKDILQLMDEKADSTYFADYAPDMFTLKKYDIYKKMINLEEQKKQIKSKRLFRKKMR